MVEVLHQLLRDHVNMRSLLDLVEDRVAPFRKVGTADVELLRAIMRYTLEYPARIHERRELLVYQRLIERQATAAEVLKDLPSEHASLHELSNCLATQVESIESAGQPELRRIAELAREYVDAYRRHIDMEELQFFPLALKHLLMSDWREIDATVTAPDDPVFGVAALQPFVELRRQIAMLQDRGGTS